MDTTTLQYHKILVSSPEPVELCKGFVWAFKCWGGGGLTSGSGLISGIKKNISKTECTCDNKNMDTLCFSVLYFFYRRIKR